MPGRKEIMLRFQYRYSIGLYSVIYLQPPHKERQRERERERNRQRENKGKETERHGHI